MNTNTQKNTRGPLEGVEIYTKKFNLNGTVSSDTYAKIVTDEYNSSGDVVVQPTPDTKQGGIKGVFFEVGGDMLQDGIIKTDKDATVDIKVRGGYTSNKGKILQGDDVSQGWHMTWWGIAMTTVICSVIATGIAYYLGWNQN